MIYDSQTAEDNNEAKRESSRQCYLLSRKHSYEANRKSALAKARIYYKANRQRIRARQNHYNETHREQIEKHNKHYRLQHRDEIRNRNKAYHLANPERRRMNSRKHKALKRGAVIGNPKVITAWEKLWKSRKQVTCYWCCEKFRPMDCHTDHIIPLAKGGAHSIENVCVSCEPCNQSKKAKLLAKWNSELQQPVLL